MSSDKRITASPVLGKVLELLKNIKSTEAGNVIFDHVKDMVLEADNHTGNVEQHYAVIASTLLDAIASHVGQDESLLMQIRLIRQRLVPPVSDSEIEQLLTHVQTLAGHLGKAESVVHADTCTLQQDTSLRKEEEDATRAEPVVRERRSDDRLEQANDIDELRDSLARHVQEAIAQNQQFGVLLGVELEALREAETIGAIDERRVALIGEIERLIKRHSLLSEKFSNASKYLAMIETDNQQLSDELDRVRLLSLTDELTTLSNRRAFMRRLDDEVGRVKRYGYPISLVLIDLDGFKAINDKYGHAGGDAVLKCYAEEVLTIFRHHDMVARYGGEEFAVILPNTDKDGALSALKKVQQGVSQIFCMLNEETIPMPTFSAGLAQYVEGESPEQFIERADDALYQAKELGRNRIELAREEKIKKAGRSGGFSAQHQV